MSSLRSRSETIFDSVPLDLVSRSRDRDDVYRHENKETGRLVTGCWALAAVLACLDDWFSGQQFEFGERTIDNSSDSSR